MLMYYKSFLNENYTEIEFICFNSKSTKSDDSTNELDQIHLFNELKNYKNDLLPYMQIFDETQKSLAVIILNKNKESYYKKLISSLAKKHNIRIDLINSVTNRFVDDIITNRLEHLQK